MGFLLSVAPFCLFVSVLFCFLFFVFFVFFLLETVISFRLELLPLRIYGARIQLCGGRRACLRGVSLVSGKIENSGSEPTASGCIFDLLGFLRGV